MQVHRSGHDGGKQRVPGRLRGHFFSDDNFMVSEHYTQKLLHRLIEWNTTLPHPVQFSCQTDVRITDNEEMLRLMADARFAAIFLGVESIRRKCLKEINKAHLYRADLSDRIQTMAGFGLLPFIGLIVGFDADDADTFDEIEQFLNDTGIPIVSISVLNAPEGTPLHQRLDAAGRIDEQFAGVWHFFDQHRTAKRRKRKTFVATPPAFHPPLRPPIL